jgi:hypothetical protein
MCTADGRSGRCRAYRLAGVRRLLVGDDVVRADPPAASLFGDCRQQFATPLAQGPTFSPRLYYGTDSK